MKNNILVSEHFSSGRRHYFLDFKRTSTNGRYIQITRSDEQGEGTYERHSVVVFEEDFEFLIQAFSSLFHAAAYQGEGEVRVADLKKERKESGIKAWEAECRPRERMLSHGAAGLSDAELLAILIGSGTPRFSAVDLAGLILEHAGNNLLQLGQMEYKRLLMFEGMGMAKSCAILAAMELGRRMFRMQTFEGPCGIRFTNN